MTPAPNPTAEAAPPEGRWLDAGDRWTLRVAGNWRGSDVALPAPPEPLRSGRVTIDASALTGWDARLASALWQRLAVLDRGRLELDMTSLPPGLQQILQLALPEAAPAGAPPTEPPPPRWRGFAEIGQRVSDRAANLRTTFGFFGETLIAFGRLLRGRTDMRAADLDWQIDQTGPRSLPIIALVSFLVGLIVAYMGAGQLVRFGAETYIADLVTVGVVREIAALLVGIVLGGRVGAAFAAQIGSMRANEEIDALQTLGIRPVEHLVLPRVLALLLVGPLLTAFAALVGMAAGWLVAVAIFGVSPLDYAYQSVEALTLAHVLIGLAKGTVYALLVALAGCRQGLAAGRSAQAVGDATTTAVVQAIVWIVIAASAMTVMFQRLGW